MKIDITSGDNTTSKDASNYNSNNNSSLALLQVSSDSVNNRKRRVAEDSDDDLLLLTSNVEGLANAILVEVQAIRAGILLRKQKKLAAQLGFK